MHSLQPIDTMWKLLAQIQIGGQSTAGTPHYSVPYLITLHAGTLVFM